MEDPFAQPGMMLSEGLANFSATCIKTVGADDGLKLCGCGPSVNSESLMKVACTYGVKSTFSGSIFSYCEGAWLFSVFFLWRQVLL